MLHLELVKPSTPPELLEKVGRLRYEVFCLEEGRPYESHEGKILDSLEVCSVSFLISIGPRNIGTIRFTPKIPHTVLELEIVNPEWEKIIATTPKEHTCEMSRFAVLKDYRGTAIPYELILNAFRYALERDFFYVYIPGKVGVLERFYRSLGFIKLTKQPTEYSLGAYHLMFLDLRNQKIIKRLVELKNQRARKN